MALCRYCNTELQANLKFCTKCGKSINSDCIYCGAAATPGSECCPQCELKIDKSTVRRRGMSPKIFVGFLVLMIFMAGQYFFLMSKSKPHGEFICGFSSNSNEILFIDKNTKEIYKKISSEKTRGPMILFDNNIYVASAVSGINVIDILKNQISRLNIDEEVINMIITKDGTTIYATNPEKNTLLHISLPENQLIASIKAGSVPSGLVLDEYNKKLYVANFKSNDITVIDTSNNIPVATIKDVGNGPYRLLIIGERNYLYSVNYNSNDVTLINTGDNSIVKKIPTGSKPLDIIMTNDKKNLYVANFGSDFISVINVEKQSVVNEIKLNGNPLCLGLSSDGNILVSVKSGSWNKILSIDPVTSSLKDEINTGECQIFNFIDVKLNN
jgi:YVTN family beta-propeller protein